MVSNVSKKNTVHNVSSLPLPIGVAYEKRDHQTIDTYKHLEMKGKADGMLMHKVFQNYSRDVKLKSASRCKRSQLLPLKVRHLKVPREHICAVVAIFPSLQQTPVPAAISVTNSQHTKHQKEIENSNLCFANAKMKVQVISISMSLFKRKARPGKKYNLTMPVEAH